MNGVRRTLTITGGLLVPLLAAACGKPAADAYGNFETTEVTVSSEVPGRLLRQDAREGDTLRAGQEVALVDTTSPALDLREARAHLEAARAGTRQARSRAAALEARLERARREYARTRRLHADQAATVRQLDAARADARSLADELRAAREGVAGSRETASALEARIASLEDRLSKSRVANPLTGTVLTRIAEPGEFVQPGQPLYRIASLDTLELRAYVGEPQLPKVRVGEAAEVRIDTDGGRRSLPGRVSWVSSQAEFTPTRIQTRDERTDLVYAVKIRVANPEGELKIGMPGEVVFAGAPADSARPAAAAPGGARVRASGGGR
ncbi:MAG TPA: HlyD family efflux transporter periplasmic adaptor subunit [Gemmatimonadota bacterium]|nr:HlyD family efflux transporter periplasmic adaptor subunit [Gemmatimonadota bacterium]